MHKSWLELCQKPITKELCSDFYGSFALKPASASILREKNLSLVALDVDGLKNFARRKAMPSSELALGKQSANKSSWADVNHVPFKEGRKGFCWIYARRLRDEEFDWPPETNSHLVRQRNREMKSWPWAVPSCFTYISAALLVLSSAVTTHDNSLCALLCWLFEASFCSLNLFDDSSSSPPFSLLFHACSLSSGISERDDDVIMTNICVIHMWYLTGLISFFSFFSADYSRKPFYRPIRRANSATTKLRTSKLDKSLTPIEMDYGDG